MLTQQLRISALALAAGGLTLAAPASAYPSFRPQAWTSASVYGGSTAGYGDDEDDDHDEGRHRGWSNRDRHDDRRDRRDYRRYAYRGGYQPQPYYQNYPSNYGEPVYRNTRVWQGDDGRYYCRRSNGTTGLLIGGAAGALLGREVAGRNGDRTLGAILGAAGGALLGRSIDSKTRCR